MKRKKFQSFVSIDPYNKTFFLYENSIIKKFNLSKISSKHFYISYIQTKDLIISSIKISKHILPEDLRDAIEIKAYEELDLDQAIAYKIDFIEFPTPSHEKERIFQVFIIDPDKIEEIFQPLSKKFAFIDQIIPAPLLYQSLYKQNIFESSNIDAFIYFQREDASITIYKEGNFLYAKSIKYSFEDIAQKISELKGTTISTDEVIKNVGEYGLILPDLDEMQYYMKIFGELFMHIKDILIYTKRAYNIEQIDNIYISSDLGPIQGIQEYAQTYLAQETKDFDFTYNLATQEPYIEDLHYLLLLDAIDIVENGTFYPNLTLFKRLPPLFKRPSGELLIITAAAVIISIAYPLYNYFIAYKYKIETSLLQKEYTKVHQKRVQMENKLTALRKEIQKLKEKINLQQEAFNKRKDLLNQIYNKKVNYIMKAKTLADLTQDLVRYKIKTISIINKDKSFDFNITATDEKQITKFIQYIADKKYELYDISTKDINKTEANSSVYFSTLEVHVK